MILLFIPIGIMVDIAEKIDKLKEKEVPLSSILEYYVDFTWYFANLLFPIFLFLSVIWFTSKLANNSEIIAILSSGISFFRYLRPFLISASIIAVFSFLSGMFIVPKSNKGFNDFRYKYLVKKEARDTDKVYLQINENEYIYVNNYDPVRKQASNFTFNPPIFNIWPLRVISPVIAVSALTGIPVKIEINEIAIAPPALGPSFGVAPSGT